MRTVSIAILTVLVLTACQERKWHDVEPLPPQMWTRSEWLAADDPTKLATAARWTFETLSSAGTIGRYRPADLRQMGLLVATCIDAILYSDQSAGLVPVAQFCIFSLIQQLSPRLQRPQRSGPEGSA